jgi:hypothetical protein
MDYDEIFNKFKNKKYKIEKDKFNSAFYIETDGLMVGVFDFDYPNDNYRGKILAEHLDNFDKWSKAFYMSDFPNNKDELNIILNDLKHIADEKNKKSGNNFGHLVRTF